MENDNIKDIREFLYKKYEKSQAVISRTKTDEIAWISIFLVLHGWIIYSLTGKEASIYFENIQFTILIQIIIYLFYFIWLMQLGNIRNLFLKELKQFTILENYLQNEDQTNKYSSFFRWYLNETRPFGTNATIYGINSVVTILSICIIFHNIQKYHNQYLNYWLIASIIIFIILFISYWIKDIRQMKKIFYANDSPWLKC